MHSHTERSELELATIGVVARLVKRSPDEIGLDDSLLHDLHLDSLHVLELLTLLEEEFGFETSAEDLRPEVFNTVSSLVTFVQSRQSA
ncbi:phosphopantetheine-binding protein [Cohnella boryungensis]|uniref:phosphopantetheine-binding protein n=1 Tax=Cohnella boryungensis TaxID=768479 RepID=UPI001957E841